jgi:O-antigen/teichoic acid export membrane protein
MRSRVLRRRSATALGVYVATGLGLSTTIVATRGLGVEDYARFAAILAATTFFQVLLDLTAEDALVKYGFRYVETQRWGRLRRIFEIALAFKVAGGALAGIAIVVIAPFAEDVWGVGGVLGPMLIASALPLAQAPEGVASGAILLRGRYDVRAAFLTVSAGLRLVGVAVGMHWGVDGAVLGIVIAQVVATAAISTVGLAAFRRFPQERSEALGEDRRPVRQFVVASTIGSSLTSARATLGTALLPAVAPIAEAGYFRNAQAPATGLATLSAPARIVMLTEQTRDFEAGRHSAMYAMLRRYILGTAALMVAAVPVLWIAMPWLMQLFYGIEFREHATTAARLVLVAAALQFVWGWTKSFPVSIGRPGLRNVALGVETAIFVPLLLVLGDEWGATGGAAATVVSTAAFCVLWVVLLARVRSEHLGAEAVPS